MTFGPFPGNTFSFSCVPTRGFLFPDHFAKSFRLLQRSHPLTRNSNTLWPSLKKLLLCSIPFGQSFPYFIDLAKLASNFLCPESLDQYSLKDIKNSCYLPQLSLKLISDLIWLPRCLFNWPPFHAPSVIPRFVKHVALLTSRLTFE